MDRDQEVAELLHERAGYIAEVRKWRARDNEITARKYLKECERVNARLTELDYFDIKADVYIELPALAVEG
jgi:hypothetical protein